MSDIIEHYKNRDPTKRICARGICIRGSEVLVIKRHKYGEDYIVLPGGGIDEGETDFEAASREVLEETSIQVRPVKLILTLPWTTKDSEQRIVLCEYISGEPKLDPNSEEANRTDDGQNTYEPMWVSIDIAKESLQPSQVREIL